jgi:hypothetical protein
MALQAVQGVYHDGKVELSERPEGVERARVVVTFLPELAGPDADTEAKERERKEAVERMLARMRAGIDFGGEKFNRDEIYEERMRELEERYDRHKRVHLRSRSD